MIKVFPDGYTQRDKKETRYILKIVFGMLIILCCL